MCASRACGLERKVASRRPLGRRPPKSPATYDGPTCSRFLASMLHYLVCPAFLKFARGAIPRLSWPLAGSPIASAFLLSEPLDEPLACAVALEALHYALDIARHRPAPVGVERA
eukprot:12708373-Alexandrium_andersonii.AAC.1